MKNNNAGLRFGLFGGVLVVLLYLFSTFILKPIWSRSAPYNYSWSSDLIIWIIECFLFYFLGRAAAEQHYQRQAYHEEPSEPFAGVQSAGMSATLLTWLIGWSFVGVRAFIWDANGYRVVIEPVSLLCGILLTAALSIAIGAAAGSSVVKKYQDILKTD